MLQKHFQTKMLEKQKKRMIRLASNMPHQCFSPRVFETYERRRSELKVSTDCNSPQPSPTYRKFETKHTSINVQECTSAHYHCTRKLKYIKRHLQFKKKEKSKWGNQCSPLVDRQQNASLYHLSCCIHMENDCRCMMQTRRKGPATTFLDKDTIAIEVVNLSESTRVYAEV